MSYDADVIVVGGGPAGSVAALLLARAGIDVTLLDRASFPREKPCGDCLSAEATRLLERIDVLRCVETLPHARLRGWRIVAPAGHDFAAMFTGTDAIAVERILLDAALLRAARDAGVRVIESTRVRDVIVEDDIVRGVIAEHRSGKTQYRARHTIGADGLRSVVARRLGAIAHHRGIRKLSLTAHVDGVMDFHDIGEMHVGDGICIGVAPIRADRHRWNVTLVADADRFGRIVATDAVAFFLDAARSLPQTRDRIPRVALRRAMDALLASGPFDVPTRRIAWPGASLVGDAAGYFDPFTGQGVYHGMRTAEILAATLVPLLRTHDGVVDVAHSYQRGARRVTRAPRRLQRAIDVVLSRPSVANRAIRRISRAPAAASALVDITGDVLPVRALFSRDVARSFLFPDPSQT